MPSSAQWMSSKASTSGRCEAIPSTTARTAEKNASRIFCGSSSGSVALSGVSMPSRRPISAALRR